MPNRFPSTAIARFVQRSRCRCVCLLLILSLAAAAQGASPEPAANDNGLAIPPVEDILATLRPGHPRVMVGPETFDDLRALIRKGGLPAQIYVEVKKSADQLLSTPVSKYEKPDGRRLLSVSRRVLDRVRTLAMVSRIEGDHRYADRAWRELQAAAAFQDWNPSHFLDTAEMTHAFALGYDWLYDCWSEDQRRVLREAIVSKGLRDGLRVYESKKGWPFNENNWNQVCNGGLISGALAIADEESEIAARIVYEAVSSVPLAMRHYAPDDAGTEGVTYWDYGSRYNIVLLSSLETALGTDFGLSRVGAFDQSGYYQIYLCGAGRVAFDFADCGRSRVSEAQHFWLARKYDIPVFRWFRLSALQSGERGGTLDLLWYDDRGQGLDFKTLPLDRHFRGAECAALRSSWEPDAMMVGIQAGDSMNLGGHRHLDLGSFVLDALGERWITDSGVEHETYMAHWHKNPRYAYCRVRAEGHNVPVFNPGQGPDQNPKAVAKIVNFESTPQQAVATVDLTERDVRDARYVSPAELKKLRELVRRLDPLRVVTASFGGHDLSEQDVREALQTIALDFLSPHRPRTPGSPAQTGARTRECLELTSQLGRPVPVHHQEPFRRGYGRWDPAAADFLTDLRGAVAGGAAGWRFHNGAQRTTADSQPRRSFDMRQQRLFEQLDAQERQAIKAMAVEVQGR